MSTYRVVTAAKTVYVHNVDDRYSLIEGDPLLGHELELVFHRVGMPEMRFPWVNVISYEKTA